MSRPAHKMQALHTWDIPSQNANKQKSKITFRYKPDIIEVIYETTHACGVIGYIKDGLFKRIKRSEFDKIVHDSARMLPKSRCIRPDVTEHINNAQSQAAIMALDRGLLDINKICKRTRAGFRFSSDPAPTSIDTTDQQDNQTESDQTDQQDDQTD
jgi:hypothetical protein